MKFFILFFMCLLTNAGLACDKPRALDQNEKTKFIKMACDSFDRIYGPWMRVNNVTCLKQSRLKICENTPDYGTYLYGKIIYDDFRSKECNFILNKGKIVSADCGDE